MRNPYALTGPQLKLLTEVDEKGGKGRKSVPTQPLIEKYGIGAFKRSLRHHLEVTLSGVRITATGRDALKQYQL